MHVIDMQVYIKTLGIALLGLVALTGIYAATYEVSAYEKVRIDIDRLEGSKIIVQAQKTYIPFDLIIEDVPEGYYTLEIPEEELETIICAPTAFNVTSDGEDLSITCIAKPTEDTVDVKLKRQHNGTTKTYDFTFEIETSEVWYEVWSGGMEAGYYITNGRYIIDHKPRQLVSQIIVKKGQEMIWTGLMFPGQEEKITDDLKIKFLGALDNVTYLKIYSTSDDKFYPVQAKPQVVTKVVKEYVYPDCRVEDNWIIISHTNATIIYTDGSTETVDATETTVRLRKKDVKRVICGYVIDVESVQYETPTQPQQPTPPPQEERPRFITAPKSRYYTGETVTIVANREFEISCTNGLHETTKIFTRVFNEPVSCTVVLGDQVKTFSVIEKQAALPQQPQPQKPQTNYGNIAIALALLLIVAGYFIYKKYKEGELVFPFQRKKKEQPSEGEKEEEEVEFKVKSALEGKH